MTLTYHEDGNVEFSDAKVVEATQNVKPGFYTLTQINSLFGSRTILKQAKDLVIPRSAEHLARQLMDMSYLEKLFGERSLALHADLGITTKAGYLFHGKQGSGKTTTMQCAARILIESMNAVAFIIEDLDDYMGVKKFVEKQREDGDQFITVILWDECEEEFYHKEGRIKPLLDGMSSIKDCVLLCGTNYIDRIPETIKDRPSRFRAKIQIDNMTEADVIFNIVQKMNETLRPSLRQSDKNLRSLTEELHSNGGATVDEIKTAFVTMAFEASDLGDLGVEENEKALKEELKKNMTLESPQILPMRGTQGL